MEQDFRFVVLAPDSTARPFPNRQQDGSEFRLMQCHPRTDGALRTTFAWERAAKSCSSGRFPAHYVRCWPKNSCVFCHMAGESTCPTLASTK